MGGQLVKSAISYHNRQQLEYFDEKIKKTMVPVDSTYVNKHINRFLSFADLSREHSILEVGCGMGKFTLPLAKMGFKIAGLDLSPFLLQKLLEYNDNRFNIPLIVSDILEIPEEYNERFDRVICFFTLHHFHHLETYFQAMSRVLKPGGQIVFVEPNAFNPLYYFQITFTPGMNWKGDKGVMRMHEKNFRKAAEYADLELIESAKYGFFPPFIVNTSWGARMDDFAEGLKMFEGIRPFIIVKLTKA
ncbi:MAG: hypothetical protein Roseis2KO_57780 [Roseivirga sp.]